MNYCVTCKYADNCELAYGTNFCVDCNWYDSCPIRTMSCEAGYEIECNNGFEDKIEYFGEYEESGECE